VCNSLGKRGIPEIVGTLISRDLLEAMKLKGSGEAANPTLSAISFSFILLKFD
jgi:hypothetical protein